MLRYCSTDCHSSFLSSRHSIYLSYAEDTRGRKPARIFGTDSASEMTYIVSGGALNSTHSLTSEPNYDVVFSFTSQTSRRWVAENK